MRAASLVLAAAMLLTLASTASAAPCEDSFDLAEGERSPCDGTLITPGDAVYYLGLETTLKRERSAAIGDSERAAAKIAALEKKLTDSEAARAACEADKVVVTTVDRPQSWYEEPAFLVTAGVVVGAVVVVLVDKATD